jgi:N-lysine methyltransferase SETD6
VANTDISADEELFAVPRSLVLRKTNSELYSKIPASFTDLGPWDSLTLVIVYEYLRNASSPWFPYLRLLPTTFDTLMFWTPQELSELQGSAVVDKIGKEPAEESWRTTILPIMLSNEALFPLPSGTAKQKERQLIELAHMAGSMIMAYAFDLDEDDSNESEEDIANEVDSDLTEDDEHNPSKGMVPFADMLNADAHRNNARLFHENDFLIMKANKDIKAGDEIFNDYGPLPRSDLLRMYGYITDNYSAFDVVEMSAGLIENVAASSGTERSYLGRAVGFSGNECLHWLT